MSRNMSFQERVMLAEQLEAAKYVIETPWFRAYNILLAILIYSFFAVDYISGFWSLVGGFVVFEIFAIILSILYQIFIRIRLTQPFVLIPAMIASFVIIKPVTFILQFFRLSEDDFNIYSQGITLIIMHALASVAICYFCMSYIAKIFG